jgi:hypothetical protein
VTVPSSLILWITVTPSPKTLIAASGTHESPKIAVLVGVVLFVAEAQEHYCKLVQFNHPLEITSRRTP